MLQSTLDEWRAQANVPVVTAAVRLNGSLVWHGVAVDGGVENASELSPQSRYCIYSITKTFTAVCVLRLAAAGVLRIDDPVRRWFPDLPVTGSMAIRHLLQHTSGLRDYGPLRAYHEAVRTTPSNPWTDQEFLDATLPNGLLFEPGSGWSYSNVGYMLLRLLIQRATGRSFREYMDEEIVSRLGLTNTFVAETVADWSSCVPGYGSEVRTDAHVVDVRSSYHPGWCAPGVSVSNVDEVTQFYDGLLAGVLLDRNELEQMLQLVRVPGTHPPTVSPSCGLGILGDPDSPLGPSFGHGGGGPGYSLATTILPRFSAGRLSVAVFCNSSEGQNAGLGEQALLIAAVETLAVPDALRRATDA